MPGRIAVRAGRAAGPRPFSSEWLAADAPEESPPTAFRLPPWVPSGRAVSTAILVVVSIAAASAAIVGGDRVMFVSPAPTQTLTESRRRLPRSTLAAGSLLRQQRRRPRWPCWLQMPTQRRVTRRRRSFRHQS